MTRPYIPFLAFLVLLLLTIPFPFDFTTSVGPGWHTIIFPPYFVWGIIVVIFFASCYNWLLASKKTSRQNQLDIVRISFYYDNSNGYFFEISNNSFRCSKGQSGRNNERSVLANKINSDFLGTFHNWTNSVFRLLCKDDYFKKGCDIKAQ